MHEPHMQALRTKSADLPLILLIFGLGEAWEILSVETMYVGLIVIALLGFLFSLALTELERWLVPWKAAF